MRVRPAGWGAGSAARSFVHVEPESHRQVEMKQTQIVKRPQTRRAVPRELDLRTPSGRVLPY